MDALSLRHTHAGPVVGLRMRDDVHAWLGIPYAAPPVGELRWRRPRPVSGWSAVRHAVVQEQCASQREITLEAPAGQIRGSEDCLYLNVYSPACAPSDIRREAERLPVMVWIHGGSNQRGEAAHYDGSELAARGGVIVVTVNFRLGVFGWLRHAALRAHSDSSLDHSGNFALLDLCAALQWVQRNIAAFGGDPGDVTLFGESSGAQNVFALLVARPAAGLFHKAIVQSGGMQSTNVTQAERLVEEGGLPLSSQELLLQLLVNDGNCGGRAQARAKVAKLSIGQVHRYLQRQSFVDFDRAYRAIAERTGVSALEFPQLFHDGDVLPADGIRGALQRGAFDRSLPLLIGATRDEFNLLLVLMPDNPFVSRSADGAVVVNDSICFYTAARCLSELLYAENVVAAAERFERAFVYRFDWDRLRLDGSLHGVTPGAMHGLDVPCIFGRIELGAPFFFTRSLRGEALSGYWQVSACMIDFWAEFAHAGDPGAGLSGARPRWALWHDTACTQRHRMLFCEASQPETVDLNQISSVDVWRRLEAMACALSPERAQALLKFTESVARRFGLLPELRVHDDRNALG